MLIEVKIQSEGHIILDKNIVYKVTNFRCIEKIKIINHHTE